MAKRANGEGSYIHIRPAACSECPDRENCKKIGNPLDKCSKRDRQDRWCFQYTATQPDGSKRTKQLYARTKKELQRRVERMQAETGQDFKMAATLGAWLDVWKDRYLANTVQGSTSGFYTNMLKYVPERLRNMQLTKITPIMLQMFFSELLEHGSKKGKPLSTKTVKSVRQTLGTALEAAIDNGFLVKNPVKKTKPPVEEIVREIVILDEDEIHRLLKVAESGEYYDDYKRALKDDDCQYHIRCFAMAIRLALATGVRWGECFGLCTSDCDYDQKTIYIHNNLQDGVLKRPKTKSSVRKITVDTDTMQRLQRWGEYQKKHARLKGDKFNETMGLLFTQANGKPVRYDNFRIRYFDKIRVKAMLPKGYTFHKIRHTHACLLLSKNISITDISYRLGHSSVYATMVYLHKLPKMDDKAADIMGDILQSKDDKS